MKTKKLKWYLSSIQHMSAYGTTYCRRGIAALGEPSIVYMVCWYDYSWRELVNEVKQ